MGGVGSGNWHRFDKKTTTSKCQSVDVRHLHRDGLLKSGHWFTLRWSRAGKEAGSIRGAVIGEGGRGDPNLPPPKRSRQRMGRRAGARALNLDGMQLRR
jgi:hypothetical protein